MSKEMISRRFCRVLAAGVFGGLALAGCSSAQEHSEGSILPCPTGWVEPANRVDNKTETYAGYWADVSELTRELSVLNPNKQGSTIDKVYIPNEFKTAAALTYDSAGTHGYNLSSYKVSPVEAFCADGTHKNAQLYKTPTFVQSEAVLAQSLALYAPENRS